MNALHALQCQLAEAMRDGVAPSPASLCGDALADRDQRFAIYQRGYCLRLRDALATEFPGLRLLAGRRFETLLDAYVAAHPSTHYNIRWHGQGMTHFLGQSAPWSARPAWAEVAALDWAISTAFDAADESPIDASALADIDPAAWATLRLRPLRHAAVLACALNADAFRRAADQDLPRPRPRYASRARHLLVWRPSTEVRYRRVDADELPVLKAALQGAPLAQLCERLAERRGPHHALPTLVSLLQRWLADGLIGGVTMLPTPSR
ncbi:DNA-binding domain-containing protein [Dyella sp. ASV21]|uniref:HvfC/BufC family peptide modification chaperone n=1 Tax=Dyella sp. ASV21 TaxID=2795114 RepID=UPI0018EB3C40